MNTQSSLSAIMREQFLKEYEEWRKTGVLPGSVSLDMRHYLGLNEKRLKKKGLTISESFENVEEAVTGELGKDGPVSSAKVSYRELRHVTEYDRDGKRIKRTSSPDTVYVTVLDKKGYRDHLCTCPNCGRETLASKLAGGCPYCGTVFEIRETYPCVTSMYSVPGIIERKKFTRDLKKYLIAVAVIVFVLGGASFFFTTAKDYVPWARVLMSLFMGAVSAGMMTFAAYMLLSIGLIAKVFFMAGKSMPLLGGISTKKRLNRYMEKSDPSFTYELFEGKIISMMRAAAFSDDRSGLVFYRGSDDLAFLDDIVDMQYRGVIKLLSARVEGGLTKLALRAYMTDTYCVDGKIKTKDESFDIECERKSQGTFDLGFSVRAVTCASCGASFDAVHQKNCPYCGSTYDLTKDDWVITSIR